MQINFIVILIAALIPLLVGFAWYNPKTFGNAWMQVAGVTPDAAKDTNMAKVFGLTYILGILAAYMLTSIVIHQNHIFSSMMNEPGVMDPSTPAGAYAAEFMKKYGNEFRTFGHGALHGAIAGICLALPVLAVNALFERKSFRYIAINAGFWIVCFALMGGVICRFT